MCRSAYAAYKRTPLGHDAQHTQNKRVTVTVLVTVTVMVTVTVTVVFIYLFQQSKEAKTLFTEKLLSYNDSEIWQMS